MKKLGLDIGTVRIGVATSDPLGIIASAYQVYTRKFLKADVYHFADLAKTLECDTIVIGKPLKMDGSAGQSVDMVNQFADELKKICDVPIVFVDERLTTVSAQRILIEGNVRREKRKNLVDAVAATIILQTYLDKPKN